MKDKTKKRPRNAALAHETTLEQEMNPDRSEELNTKKKTPKSRVRQEEEEYIDPKTSSRILAEARKQQWEISHEKNVVSGRAATRNAFASAASKERQVVAKMGREEEEDEEFHGREEEEEGQEGFEEGGNETWRSFEEEEEIDGASEGGFSDSKDQYEELLEQVTEEDERALSLFMAKDAAPQRTLADIIMGKIKEAGVGEEEKGQREEGGRFIPGLDQKVTEVYRSVGTLLTRYRSGKVPKAFKIIPSLSNWEEVLYLTSPETWTPASVYVATRLFASNLNARMARRFYSLVLLPRIRQDIKSQKRLHFALYQALKKAVYKPGAFYRGILLPLCQSGTCTLREAVIIGSVLSKVSIPVLHSSVAIMKIAEMNYSGTNSYFMKLLMDKKYALPYRVVDALVDHFHRFVKDERDPPVIWHQCLLTFVQRYKDEIKEEDKERLRELLKKHKHYLVTPEVLRELHHARERGAPKGAMAQSKPSGASGAVVISALDEDVRDMPDVVVEMDED